MSTHGPGLRAMRESANRYLDALGFVNQEIEHEEME
jgi:hypothetical protein